MRVFLVVLLLAFAGCATHPRVIDPNAITSDDAVFVGNEIASYVATVLPPASSTVWIAVPAPEPHLLPSPLGATTSASLRDRGFAVVEDEAGSAGAHVVRFDAAPLDGGVLVQVVIDQAAASRVYARDASGVLAAASPFTVRAAP